MFVRAKKSGRYEYLQVVQNERVDGRVRQRVIATLGRVDQLQEEGHIDALLSSCSRFAQNVAVTASTSEPAKANASRLMPRRSKARPVTTGNGCCRRI